MDNILFVNEYTRTKDTMKEVYQYWYFKRPLSVIFYVFVALNVIIRLFTLLTEGYVDPLTTFLVVFIGLLYPSLYFIQLHSASKKDSQLMHNSDMKATIYVSADRFYPSLDNENVYIDISSVNYAFETGSYIVLVMKSTRLMLMFHKEGFTTGSLDGFISHLREKKIRIKGRKR